jgi:hypothetical protein
LSDHLSSNCQKDFVAEISKLTARGDFILNRRNWLKRKSFDASAAIVMPSGTGVNIHFLGGHTNELRMIAQAGFKLVRTDCTWSDIERQKGECDWSAQDELTSHLLESGLRPIYVLDYSNPLYERNIDGYALALAKPQKCLEPVINFWGEKDVQSECIPAIRWGCRRSESLIRVTSATRSGSFAFPI